MIGGGDAPGAPVLGEGFGHGKVILLGEHAVVHGHAALAAGLRAGIRARARSGTGVLRVERWALTARAGDESQVGRALERILARLAATDLDFDLDARIPPRAGIGSSAAFCVAVARAAGAAAGRGEADVLAAVAEGEAVFHGTPSGIDAAAAASGAVGRFCRGEGWTTLPVSAPLSLCVGLSGRPRDTAALVSQVRDLGEQVAAVTGIMRLLGELSGEGAQALSAGDVEVLGRLMDVAHGLLAALGVSCRELDVLVHAARDAGALGAKLTGAGGGGAVIALAPGREDQVLARWRRAGFDGFVTSVGGAPGEATA